MNYLTHTLVATGLVAAMGTAAFAQDMDPTTVTCSDFVAMTPEDQTDAVSALQEAKMKADTESSTSTENAASTDTDNAETSDTDVSESGTVTSTDTDTSATADTDTSATADTSASGDAMANPEVEALKTACEGNDDALAMDQLEAS